MNIWNQATHKAITLIAQHFDGWYRAVKESNNQRMDTNSVFIDRICDLVMPHGSGIDGNHAKLDFDRSKPNRLVFAPFDFHHMNDGGYYDGWSEHELIVSASLAHGYELKITGRDRNDVKEYLYQTIDYAITRELFYDRETGQFRLCDDLGYAMEQFAHALIR